MLKGNDVVGCPVLIGDTDRRIKRVEDVVADPVNNRILGFLVDEGGWSGGAYVLPWSAVSAVRPDAVIVASEACIVRADWTVRIKTVLERVGKVVGRRIMTTDGRDLGRLTDVFFDSRTGRIEGYEVVEGEFASAYGARSFVPALGELQIAGEVVLAPPAAARAMEEQDTGGTPSHGPDDGADALARAKGRRARREVRAAHGGYVAAQGQIVGERVVARARAAGKEKELLRAVGLPTEPRREPSSPPGTQG